MSLGSRIKERREQLHLTRSELATKIGVTPSAIANYENGISSPKIEIMYELFDALDCDANYLHQDEMAKYHRNHATPHEMEIIEKYRNLDDHGKDMVDVVLDKEHERTMAAKVISITRPEQIEEPITIAAHFDGEEYTEDEMDEIRQYEEFVKSRRNK